MAPITSISCLLIITMLTEIQNPKSLKKAGNANDLLESICAIFAESSQSENPVKAKDPKTSTSKLDASHDRVKIRKRRRKLNSTLRKKHRCCSDDSCNADCKCRYASRECRPGLCQCTNCSNTYSNRKLPLFEVRESNISGARSGLFAGEDIPGGTFLGEYKGKRCSLKPGDEDHRDHQDYRVTRFAISPSTPYLCLKKA